MRLYAAPTSMSGMPMGNASLDEQLQRRVDKGGAVSSLRPHAAAAAMSIRPLGAPFSAVNHWLAANASVIMKWRHSWRLLLQARQQPQARPQAVDQQQLPPRQHPQPLQQPQAVVRQHLQAGLQLRHVQQPQPKQQSQSRQDRPPSQSLRLPAAHLSPAQSWRPTAVTTTAGTRTTATVTSLIGPAYLTGEYFLVDCG